ELAVRSAALPRESIRAKCARRVRWLSLLLRLRSLLARSHWILDSPSSKPSAPARQLRGKPDARVYPRWVARRALHSGAGRLNPQPQAPCLRPAPTAYSRDTSTSAFSGR